MSKDTKMIMAIIIFLMIVVFIVAVSMISSKKTEETWVDKSSSSDCWYDPYTGKPEPKNNSDYYNVNNFPILPGIGVSEMLEMIRRNAKIA